MNKGVLWVCTTWSWCSGRAGGIRGGLNRPGSPPGPAVTQGQSPPACPAQPDGAAPGRAQAGPTPSPHPALMARSPPAPSPREAEQRPGERNADLLQERGAEPGPTFTWFCCYTQRARPFPSSTWDPPAPLHLPWEGGPGLSPSSGTSPALSPSPVPPSVAEHQFPSLLGQGTPPSQPKESCTNPLHCTAAPRWGHEKTQQKCWGSCPLPAPPELLGVSSSASPVAAPAPGPC